MTTAREITISVLATIILSVALTLLLMWACFGCAIHFHLSERTYHAMSQPTEKDSR